MPRTKSPSTDWTSCLQRELAETTSTEFPEGSMTLPEIAAEFKSRGMPCGASYVQTFVTRMVREGKARMFNGIRVNEYGRKVREVRYLLS